MYTLNPPTLTESFFFSNHLTEHKIAVYRYLITHMRSHSLSPEWKQKEWNIIQHISKANNLPYTLIQKLNLHTQRTGCNMVKSSSPNTPSTWLIFIFPRTHASPQVCHHSASSILAVRISCCVIAVFVFRDQQEELRSRWIHKTG